MKLLSILGIALIACISLYFYTGSQRERVMTVDMSTLRATATIAHIHNSSE